MAIEHMVDNLIKNFWNSRVTYGQTTPEEARRRIEDQRREWHDKGVISGD